MKDRQTEDRQASTDRHVRTDRQVHTSMNRQTDRLTGMYRRQTDRQVCIDRQADRQTGMHVQTDRQTDQCGTYLVDVAALVEAMNSRNVRKHTWFSCAVFQV